MSSPASTLRGAGREIGPIGTISRVVAGVAAIALPIALESIAWLSRLRGDPDELVPSGDGPLGAVAAAAVGQSRLLQLVSGVARRVGCDPLAVKPRVPVVLGLVLLLGGVGLAFGAYASYRDQRSGTAGTAKVTSCSGHSGRYGGGLHCTGSWVAGGSLLDGGHVVIGDIANADRGDVGKTIDVRIHGDRHATKPKLRVPVILAMLGVPMLLLALYLLFLSVSRPRTADASVPARPATPEGRAAKPDGGPFEIPAGDAGLARFYCAVFGWSATADGELAARDGEVVARLRPGVPVAPRLGDRQDRCRRPRPHAHPGARRRRVHPRGARPVLRRAACVRDLLRPAQQPRLRLHAQPARRRRPG